MAEQPIKKLPKFDILRNLERLNCENLAFKIFRLLNYEEQNKIMAACKNYHRLISKFFISHHFKRNLAVMMPFAGETSETDVSNISKLAYWTREEDLSSSFPTNQNGMSPTSSCCKRRKMSNFTRKFTVRKLAIQTDRTEYLGSFITETFSQELKMPVLNLYYVTWLYFQLNFKLNIGDLKNRLLVPNKKVSDTKISEKPTKILIKPIWFLNFHKTIETNHTIDFHLGMTIYKTNSLTNTRLPIVTIKSETNFWKKYSNSIIYKKFNFFEDPD